jgi:phenylacetate-CoA ligase
MRELIFGPAYFLKKKLINQTEYSGALNLSRLQKRMLGRLLLYAIDNIPYYDKFRNLWHDAQEMDSEDLLQHFPIIDKDWIRNRLPRLVCGNKFRRLKGTTGGTTGQPLVFYMDRLHTRQVEKAFMFDQWKRVGYKFGDKIYNIRGRTPKMGQFIHHDKILNIYSASSFTLTKKNIDSYIDSIDAIKPDFIHGYPSTMYQLSVLIGDSKRSLSHRVKAVLCCSEKLFDFQRTKIESVFRCRVYTWYGHSEYLALGGACEHSNKLHFYPQYGFIELRPTGLRDETNSLIYEIIATGFNNRVMPMIRYKTGDYAIKSDSQQCTCGREYLLIDEVIGRTQEFIVDDQEQLISATSLLFGQHYRVFEGLSAIQFYQDTPGKLEILIVKHNNCEEQLILEMKKKMETLIGDRMLISISNVDEIPQSEIGKARTVIQKLPIKEYF